jgi:nucleoside-diphosphate-sugar epimerase
VTTTSPTLLVAGGRGFIGRYVCAAAERAGYAVTTLGRSPGNDIVRDLTDPAPTARPRGFGYLINLAAYSDHAATQGLDLDTVRRDSAQMIRTLTQYEPFIHRAIHVSTSEVFGDRRHADRARVDEPYRIESAYAAGKAEQERWADAYRFHLVRITNVWGDGQPATKAYPRILDAIAHGGTLTDCTGGAPVQWSWVEDVAERLVELLTEPILRREEHLAPTQADTFARFVEVTAAGLGRPVPSIEAGTPLAPVLGIAPTVALERSRVL